MSAKEFLQNIEVRKSDAAEIGMKLDLLVLPREFADIMSRAAVKEDLSDYEFRVSDTGNVYLVGVKVLWSGGRLPQGQCWFRYSRKKGHHESSVLPKE